MIIQEFEQDTLLVGGMGEVFRAEARTLTGLAHTNIATVFRFFAHEGTLYLVMECISGQPFGDMLREKRDTAGDAGGAD